MKKTIAAGGFINQLCVTGFLASALAVLLLGVAGCETNQFDRVPESSHSEMLSQTNQPGQLSDPSRAEMPGQTNQSGQFSKPAHVETLILREGDVVQITVSGSANLDRTEQIRRDGKITLELVGEITAAGLSPTNLEKVISAAYSTQLLTKEVTVAVISSSIPIFVTGAVLSPHKVMSDHPITVLEAIMEAGGFNYQTANMKDVRVIRYENGREHTYVMNLKLVLQGKQVDPFYLKSYDIIYVPERFSIY